MKQSRIACVALGQLAAVAILGTVASAQTSATPSPGAPAASGDMTGALLGAAALIVLVLIIGVGVKVLDRRRQRADEGAALQARISDALLIDPALGHLPMATTVRWGLGRRSVATIEVHGVVPSPALREVALGLVRREAEGNGRQFRIEDRIVVDPLMVEHVEHAGGR